MKQTFQQLDSMFGKIYFRGLIYDYPDSSVLANPRVIMFFENYQDYEYIEEYHSELVSESIAWNPHQ